ncbi:drab5-related [Holotrichia oblita]|uniref:Drab5-related n=1 Tax=Holotrichia oblita TaxID=644536 RepID=A0ACB9TJS7_HOLOL|nr:drab5-related [Holotrichia oblita]
MKVIVGKLVVVGHPGVGKTSTVIRYIERTFNTEVSSTIGASYFNCKMEIEDIIVKFQIWDTAGQERFKAMVPMFYRNANAALLVFDITKRESFESIKVWVKELKKNIQERIVMFVVGNKIDLPDRQVSNEEALQYSHSIGANYYECSAKEDQGIQQIFLGLARAVIQLSGTEVGHNLKVLDASSCRALVADASDANATDVGRTEVPSWSINSMAHGEVQKSGCC